MSASATVPLMITSIDPLTDPLWLGMARKKSAGLFHSPAWLRAIADTYGFPICAWIALDASAEALLVGSHTANWTISPDTAS